MDLPHPLQKKLVRWTIRHIIISALSQYSCYPPCWPRAVRWALHIGGVTRLSATEIGHAHPRQVFVPDLVNWLSSSLHAPNGCFDFPPAKVVEFGKVQNHTYPTDGEHEDQKHGLLRWSWNVALNIFDAGVSITFIHGRDIESIEEVLTH